MTRPRGSRALLLPRVVGSFVLPSGVAASLRLKDSITTTQFTGLRNIPKQVNGDYAAPELSRFRHIPKQETRDYTARANDAIIKNLWFEKEVFGRDWNCDEDDTFV